MDNGEFQNSSGEFNFGEWLENVDKPPEDIKLDLEYCLSNNLVTLVEARSRNKITDEQLKLATDRLREKYPGDKFDELITRFEGGFY